MKRFILSCLSLSFLTISYGDILDLPYETGINMPEIPYATGAILPDDYRHVGTDYGEIGGNLPEHFDWRQQVPGGLTPVDDQGRCGSCYAFTATAITQDVIKITTGREVNMSEQYLVDCAGFNGCYGGWIPHDYHFKKGKKGMISESQYPYKAANGMCRSGVFPFDRIYGWSMVAEDIESIKTAIYMYGPVWTTVNATMAFMRHMGIRGKQVFNQCESGNINHSVAIVGWGPGYWIIKNSWGHIWGDQGYGKIAWNCNKIGSYTNHIYYQNQTPLN